MVRRVFDAVADMTEDRITTAHILIQSNGGYVSDGICLYNYLSKLPIKSSPTTPARWRRSP
jgi:ATP-dependent Clp protease protease subunit